MTLPNEDIPQASAAERGEGTPPDGTAFAQIVAEYWQAMDEPRPPAASGVTLRHSDSAGCARAIGYSALGLEPSDPIDLPGWINLLVGRFVHDEWQDAMEDRFGQRFRREVPVFIEHAADESALPFAAGTVHVPNPMTAGHIDGVLTVTPDEWDAMTGLPRPPHMETNGTGLIVFEGKTIGGYGFKAATGTIRKTTPPEGPRTSAIVQGALGAWAMNADLLVVMNWAKENVAKLDGAASFCGDWYFTPEAFEPVALSELHRIAGIRALMDGGHMPARKIPGVPGEIMDPEMGTWMNEVHHVDGATVMERDAVDTGTTWQCRYCRHQTRCVGTAPGRIEIESVSE